MTPPIAYKTVQGAYLSPDGSAISGQIRFFPSDGQTGVTVYDTSGHVVVSPVPLFETLDVNGQFEIQLMVTDDPDTNPTGWVWRVSELFSGGREYEFSLPSDSPSVVNISDLTPVTTVASSYSYATTAQYASLDARMTTAEASAAVVVASVVVHPFLLMGA